MVEKKKYLVIYHVNNIFTMFIRMLMSTSITSEHPHNIHPKTSSPQIPILRMSRSMITMTLQMAIIKSLIDQKSIQADRFTDFTFTFFMKEIFFDYIVSCRSYC